MDGMEGSPGEMKHRAPTVLIIQEIQEFCHSKKFTTYQSFSLHYFNFSNSTFRKIQEGLKHLILFSNTPGDSEKYSREIQKNMFSWKILFLAGKITFFPALVGHLKCGDKLKKKVGENCKSSYPSKKTSR